MIGAKKTGPKALSVLGVLENLKQDVAKKLPLEVGRAAAGEASWNPAKARDLEAARRAFDLEKYRTAVRVY